MGVWETYSYKMNSICVFFKSMVDLGVSIATFDYDYNDIYSHVIFDTTTDEWRLVFIQHQVGNVLELPIARGYKIEIRSFEKYSELRHYFNICGNSGSFKLSDFLSHFNNKIPTEYLLDDNKRKTIISYNKMDNCSSGIYPIGTINWAVVHAKNPQMDPNKHHRSEDNLRKTRELYPNIYNQIKTMDISIKYGDIPNERTESIKDCSYDWNSVDEK